MSEPSKSPDFSLARIVLFILGFAQLLALTEIMSIAFFTALLRPADEIEIVLMFKASVLWDGLYSKHIWLNLVVYGSAALVTSLLLLPLGLRQRNRGRSSSPGEVYFGANVSGLVIFAAFPFFHQLLFFVLPWLRWGSALFVSILALGFWLVILRGTLWSLRRWRGLEMGFILGLVIHLAINFFRVCVFYLAGITLKNFGMALAELVVMLGVGWALGVLLSRVSRRRAGVARAEGYALAGFLALGILILSLPVWQWAEILLAPGPSAAWASGAAGGPQASGSRGGSAPPNVIMIVWDTVRADHLSLYGYSRPTTPFLDQLAEKSLVFDRAYSTAPWTLPSHASFFTGLYPSEHHCGYARFRLEDQFTTLAERFRENGYATLAISNNALLSPFNGFDQGFQRFIESSAYEDLAMGEIAERYWTSRFHPQDLLDSGAERTARLLSRWFKRLRKSRAPFFLFINYMEAHEPYPAAEGALKFFPDARTAKHSLLHLPRDLDDFNCNPELAAAARPELLAWYDGAISYLDQHLGRLYLELEKAGLLDRTMVIVLADHGESLGEHNYYNHGFFLYEPLLHVPLLIYYPKVLKPERVASPVSLIRLPSIILDLVQGRRPAVLEPPPGGPVPLYAEVSSPGLEIAKLEEKCPQGFDTRRLEREQKAVLEWPDKLIWDSKEKDELFQLERDPEETVNRVEQDREVYRRLQYLINLFRAAHPQTESPGPLRTDYQTKKALEALGYSRPLRPPQPQPAPPPPPAPR